MNYRFATELNGAPAGWSEDPYPSAKAALTAGRIAYEEDTPLYTAWVVPQSYADQLPPAAQLLADMKERAAERGADVNAFDSLTPADTATLESLLRKALQNWEEWLVAAAPEKRSSVVIVENLVRHAPP